MRTSIPYLSLILYLTTLITAFTSLKVPPRIKAGTQTEIEITKDLTTPSSSDAKTDSFRIYLWHKGNMCYLIRQSPITVTKLNIVIPPSVGPNDYYILVSMQVTLPPHPFTEPIFTDSARFNLTDATGEWSLFETSLVPDRLLADPDRISCEGLACARGCVKDFDEGDPRGVDDRGHYECLRACPGADYPSWEEYKNLPPTNSTLAFSQIATSTSPQTTQTTQPPQTTQPSQPSQQIHNQTSSPSPQSLTPPPPPVATTTTIPAPEPTKSEGVHFGIPVEVSELMFICLAVHFGVWG